MWLKSTKEALVAWAVRRILSNNLHKQNIQYFMQRLPYTNNTEIELTKIGGNRFLDMIEKDANREEERQRRKKQKATRKWNKLLDKCEPTSEDHNTRMANIETTWHINNEDAFDCPSTNTEDDMMGLKLKIIENEQSYIQEFDVLCIQAKEVLRWRHAIPRFNRQCITKNLQKLKCNAHTIEEKVTSISHNDLQGLIQAMDDTLNDKFVSYLLVYCENIGELRGLFKQKMRKDFEFCRLLFSSYFQIERSLLPIHRISKLQSLLKEMLDFLRPISQPGDSSLFDQVVLLETKLSEILMKCHEVTHSILGTNYMNNILQALFPFNLKLPNTLQSPEMAQKMFKDGDQKVFPENGLMKSPDKGDLKTSSCDGSSTILLDKTDDTGYEGSEDDSTSKDQQCDKITRLSPAISMESMSSDSESSGILKAIDGLKLELRGVDDEGRRGGGMDRKGKEKGFVPGSRMFCRDVSGSNSRICFWEDSGAFADPRMLSEENPEHSRKNSGMFSGDESENSGACPRICSMEDSGRNLEDCYWDIPGTFADLRSANSWTDYGASSSVGFKEMIEMSDLSVSEAEISARCQPIGVELLRMLETTFGSRPMCKEEVKKGQEEEEEFETDPKTTTQFSDEGQRVGDFSIFYDLPSDTHSPKENRRRNLTDEEAAINEEESRTSGGGGGERVEGGGGGGVGNEREGRGEVRLEVGLVGKGAEGERERGGEGKRMKRVSEVLQRTLWEETEKVIQENVLETMTKADIALQESKFEILTSELSYLNSLNILVTVFIKSKELSSILSQSDEECLFKHIVRVKKASEMFLYDLAGQWEDDIFLSGIYREIQKHSRTTLKVYIDYCSNQVNLHRTLQRLLLEDEKFVEMTSELQQSSECFGNSLNSFLMLPMQRVTRLPLLLETIARRLPDDSDEKKECLITLDSLHELVHECNEAVRDAENESCIEDRYGHKKKLSLNSLEPLTPKASHRKWSLFNIREIKLNG
ncbi:uncharacterized protein LOC111056039 [Nilaparvata lugens]|uniref:uncharacterized protein LOC111056039 n=1 Tax=Nilaparvata lugens TaxID=108931 RepID=UPI00193D4D8D|nr:uncharacterized protein LOC111056039 [Nilaparvata lugens]